MFLTTHQDGAVIGMAPTFLVSALSRRIAGTGHALTSRWPHADGSDCWLREDDAGGHLVRDDALLAASRIEEFLRQVDKPIDRLAGQSG